MPVRFGFTSIRALCASTPYLLGSVEPQFIVKRQINVKGKICKYVEAFHKEENGDKFHFFYDSFEWSTSFYGQIYLGIGCFTKI